MRKLGCLVLLIALIGAAWFGLQHLGGSANKDKLVVIEQGMSLTAAAKMLEKEGVIDSASGLLTYAKVTRSPSVKPGEYQIKQGMSAGGILKMLASGKALQRFIPIPEGMPSILVYERLMAAEHLTGTIEVPAEGSILPDNYSYVRGESRAAVVKRMQAAMTKTLAELWAQRKPSTVVKTPEEAINLAGIVEKETGKPSERRMVAGVYSNRLRIGMKLQADPTFIYPITKGKPLGRRAFKSEVNAANPYNTYVYPGLPIGPITNPGKESIKAVLDPLETRNLFFVADGTGGHVFAETNAQHEANVGKWYDIRRARGEM